MSWLRLRHLTHGWLSRPARGHLALDWCGWIGTTELLVDDIRVFRDARLVERDDDFDAEAFELIGLVGSSFVRPLSRRIGLEGVPYTQPVKRDI